MGLRVYLEGKTRRLLGGKLGPKGLCWGYTRIMEKTKETTRWGLGFRVWRVRGT